MDKLKHPKLVGGLDKRWIWKDGMGNDNYSLSVEFLAKVNNCITDLNSEIDGLSELSMKDVVYIAVLINWLSDAVYEIRELLPTHMKEKVPKPDANMVKVVEFLKAVRSFIIAHPLHTDRHEKYKLDGTLICVDVRGPISEFDKAFARGIECFYFGLDGMEESTMDMDSDFHLLAYDKKSDGGLLYKYIHLKLDDLFYAANCRIKYLEDLDKELSKLKQKKILSPR